MENNKNDVEYLKQYLKDVYTLEKEIYCSQKANEKLDNLTLASAIKFLCFDSDYLDPVIVAKAILVDLEEEC